MSIFLVGYRGSGKSSVGRKLAERLGWPFIDTDEIIVRDAGMSIREIFERGSERVFRDAEAALLFKVAKLQQHVIALGGGALIREENREILKSQRIVYLRCEPGELLRRIQGDPQTAANRPNLTALGGGIDEIRKVLSDREPIYRQMTEFEIDVTKLSPDETAAQIAARFSPSPSGRGPG